MANLWIDFAGWPRFVLPSMQVLLPLMAVVWHLTGKLSRAEFSLKEPEPYFWNGQRITTLVIFLLTGLAWIFGGGIGPRLGIATSFDTVVAVLAVLALVGSRVAGCKHTEAGTE